jgi:hypothetical protein
MQLLIDETRTPSGSGLPRTLGPRLRLEIDPQETAVTRRRQPHACMFDRVFAGQPPTCELAPLAEPATGDEARVFARSTQRPRASVDGSACETWVAILRLVVRGSELPRRPFGMRVRQTDRGCSHAGHPHSRVRQDGAVIRRNEDAMTTPTQRRLSNSLAVVHPQCHRCRFCPVADPGCAVSPPRARQIELGRESAEDPLGRESRNGGREGHCRQERVERECLNDGVSGRIRVDPPA